MPTPASPAQLRLRLLGTTELTGPDGVAVAAVLAQPRALAVFTWLCLAQPAGYRRREELLAVFWPELDEGRARAALSQALHRLRNALGKDVIVSRGGEEIAVDAARVDCDVLTLRAGLDRGDASAALIYQGDLLPGFTIDDAPAFEHWLDGERDALKRRVVPALWRATTQASQRGDVEEAGRLAHRALELAPFDEPGVRRAMTLLASHGNLAGAVQCYEQFAARLRAELELSPSPDTTGLLEDLRARVNRPASAPSPLPPAPPRSPGPVQGDEPSSGLVLPARRDRRLATVFAAGSVLLLALAVTGLIRARAHPPATHDERVLVLPFVVRGDSSLEFLSEGMVDLLATRLHGFAGLSAVDPAAALSLARRRPVSDQSISEDARLARAAGAGLLVVGRVVQMSPGVEFSATLVDSAGREQVLLRSRASDLSGISAAVDDLTRQVLGHRYRTPAERLDRLAALTTESLDALRLYLEGERDLRLGRYAPAVESFRRAVAIDSQFSLGWFRLAVGLEWVETDATERRAALARALATSARLTRRDSLLVAAYDAYAFGSMETAEADYRRLVSLYPDDVEAWFGLAEVLFHLGPLTGRNILQAEPALERVLRLHPGHVDARLHLVRLVALRGDLPGVDRLIQETLPLLAPASGQRVRLSLLRALAHRDSVALEALLPEIAELPSPELTVMIGSAASMTDYPGGAAQVAQLLVQAGRARQWRATGRMILATLALTEGRWIETRRELDALAVEDRSLSLLLGAWFSMQPWLPLTAAERDSVRRALAEWDPGTLSPVIQAVYSRFPRYAVAVRGFDLTVLAGLAGDTLAAESYLADLDALGQHDSVAATWELAGVARALLALQGGEPERALTLLEQLRPVPTAASFPKLYFLDHSLERWIRAESLRQVGRTQEAIAWYESFCQYLSLTDMAFQAPAWIRVAELRQQAGRASGAVKGNPGEYRKALERWRNADGRIRRAQGW